MVFAHICRQSGRARNALARSHPVCAARNPIAIGRRHRVLEFRPKPSRELGTTLYMFETDYALPFLPPVPAAYMAVAIEVVTPILLVLGLLTRAAALVLLGMTTVIEVFVYPEAWPTHIQWAAMLFVLLARGPGKLSLDWLIRRRFLGDG